MAKKQDSKPFEYLSTKNLETVTGVYKEFISNSNGKAVVIETDEKELGIGLSSVLEKLLKTAYNDNLLNAGQTVLKIVKGLKPQGKKYFLYDLYCDGVKIENKIRFSASEIFND